MTPDPTRSGPSPHPARLVETIFLEIVELPQDQRGSALTARCGADALLRARIERLLESDAENSADPTVGDCVVEFRQDPVPVRIGAYLVQRIAGEGGMGSVFDALHEPTGRRAAVKIVRSGISTLRGRERMRMEAETLGRLNSSHIAQIYDAGVAEVVYPDGVHAHRPFIAMEFVDGKSILEYAAAAKLSLTGKLELFQKVAAAVHHAHQRGVIHRDLKPSNILVCAADGLPKVVDFGIARLIDLTTDGLTMTGHVLGTIRYMSPEQAAGDASKVDTRSDVYSLGSILYELLGGQPVISAADGSSLSTLLRVLRDTPPPPLSYLNNQTTGDVEAIVHKALEREPVDRYPSALSLADDLRNVLQGNDIAARAPSVAERWARSIRRHKALTAAVAVAITAVLGGSIVSVWQAKIAIRQQQVAETQRALAVTQQRTAVKALDETEASLSYLTDVLASCTPEKDGHDARVLDVALRAAADVETRFKDRPLALTNIELALGRMLLSLGRPADALKQSAAAYQARLTLLGPDDERTVDAEAVRNEAALEQGKGAEIGIDYSRPPTWYRTHLGPDNRKTLEANLTFAEARSVSGHRQEAFEIIQSTAAACARAFGPDDDLTIDVDTELAFWLIDRLDEPKTGIVLIQQLTDTVSRKLGPANSQTLNCIQLLARAQRGTGQSDKAIVLLEPRMSDFETVYGVNHPLTAIAQSTLAAAYVAVGANDKVQPAYERAIARSAIAFGIDDGRTQNQRARLADWWIDHDHLADADKTIRKVLDQEMFGLAPIPNFGVALYVEGRVLLAQNRPTDALIRLKGAVAAFTLSAPDSNRTSLAMADALRALGQCFIQLHRPADAAVVLKIVVDDDQSRWNSDDPRISRDRQLLNQAETVRQAQNDVATLAWPIQPSDASDQMAESFGMISRQEGKIALAQHWESQTRKGRAAQTAPVR